MKDKYLLFLSEQEACPFASYSTRVTSPIPPAISMWQAFYFVSFWKISNECQKTWLPNCTEVSMVLLLRSLWDNFALFSRQYIHLTVGQIIWKSCQSLYVRLACVKSIHFFNWRLQKSLIPMNAGKRRAYLAFMGVNFFPAALALVLGVVR